MLADLALSCNSPLMTNGSQSPPVAASPSQEHGGMSQGKISGKPLDHEDHRGRQNWRGGSLTDSGGRASLSPPGPCAFGRARPSTSEERDPWRSRGTRNPRPASLKSPAVSPKETGKLADPSVHALISSEHSYASLASDPFKRGAASALDPRNGVEHAKAEPLLLPGKVLPFRHQQHLCPPHKLLKSYVPFPRSTVMAKRLKDDVSKFRQVTFCDRTVKVTFQWEAEYLFSLDSKYTSHPLEKTVVRAVHGPWDVGLPNSVEEMKLIIHMWVALFYSKPFKSPLARTVVEHSNPAKYVSLNSTLDSFEFVDDFEGPCGLEKGPPGSLSDTPRGSGEVTERAASPSEMPLSCDEPSSTNCIENEPTLAGSEEPSDRPWEKDQFTATACNSKDDSTSVGKEADQEPEGELLPSASAESPNRYPSLEQSDGHTRPRTPRADVEAEAEAEAKRVVNVAEAEASQSEAVPITAKLPVGEQLVAATEAAPLEMDQKRNSAPLPPDEENSNPSSAGAEALPISEVEWIEADAASQAEDMREPQDLPRDEEDTSEESTTWESIDLALSESNDTDVEPQDMDLGQGDEEPLEDTVTEEREEDTVSPNDGLLTSAASQPELPGTRKVSALPASTSTSLSPMALVEGSCLLPEDGGGGGGGGSPVGSVSQQADLTHHDKEAESADVEGTENSVSPNQTVVDEDFIISEEDAAASLMASTPKRPEGLHVQDDAELVKSQESSVSMRNQSHPSPMDLADLTHVAREEKDRHFPDSVKGPASPFGCKAVSDGTDLPENQGTFAEATERHVSPNRLDLIEDISQDGTEGAGVDTLQNREPCRVQSESTGNGEDVLVSSPTLALADFIPGPSVLQEKGEVPLADPVELPGTPAHQTSEKIKEPLRNQEESTMATEDAALPDQVDFDGEFCLPQEKEGSHLPEAAPLGVGDSLQMQHTTLVQEEQGSRPTELMNSSSDGEASQCLEKEGREFESGSENRRCVENENVGASFLEVVPGGKRDQVVRTEPEGAGSCDTVSGMNAESDGTWDKENSTVTWMSSVNLENITPPESDEDTPASSRLPHANTKWVVSEYLQQCHVVADHERAPSQARVASLSTLHKTAKYNQREIERKTLPESEATSTIMEVVPGSLHALWVDVGRSGRKHTVPSAKSCVPSEDTALDKSATSELCGVDMEQASHVASEKEERIREMSPQILSCLTTEGHREYSSEEVETLLPGDARETLGDPEDARSSSASMAVNWETGSSFVGNGHDVVGDAYPSKSGGFSCPPGEVDVTNRVCDLSLHKETSQSAVRGYPEEKERMLDAGTELTKHDDRPVTPSLDNRHHPGRFHDYINFSVTKKHKEKTRTFHSSMQHECCARAMGPVHSWNKAVGMGNDPTQNTLDTACLHFHCKVKQILKKSQCSTSTATFMKKFPRHVMTKPSSSRAVPGAPALSPPPRCHSPLLITVRNPGPRLTASPHYLRNSRHVDSFEPPPLPPLPPFVPTQEPFSKAARCANQGPGPITSFHLNKLTYSNKLKDFRGDISVIMDEFAELSRVITLDGRPRSPQGRDPRATSEEAVEERGPTLPQRTPAYEHLFAELCNTLHFRLKSVAQEACKKPYAFYLMETDNDPCFGRLKNLLKKGGHAEMEPLHFCNTSHVETDRMMVIIRNEDIFLHIHKIPCLLRLKHFPSVTFAGVDSPEDVVDCTYQELFHQGGFVVSDDHTLEAMSVGELKEMLKTLEKLQGHGQWRWLLHYKEVKQLREKARVDPAAHTKESLLKSCQGANLTEVLHYHQCDSRASPKSEHLSCVLNLQVQRISERFAVFLTDNPSSSQEALEGKGILVFDIPTFLEKAEDLASLCRSSCWRLHAASGAHCRAEVETVDESLGLARARNPRDPEEEE
ncbi:hypothetical protein JRQ81_015516 [Phrynocephalus forsythii]|uniref:Protein FAM208B n=1 Tax=Phrynocephalus forsythii TaxID=171643 RepID=A0A9Q1B2D0_9SAUR|nr:hypothetical protein JRQ81_015516 [Phrynocephalus forsythii]